jgi:hypothetical protein
MPNLGLTESQAEAVADYVYTATQPKKLAGYLEALSQRMRADPLFRLLAIGGAIEAVLLIALAAILISMWWRRQK